MNDITTDISQEILFSSNTQPESQELPRSENERLALLKQHFPNCFDKHGAFLPEKMAEELHAKGIATQKEGYSLNWLGKSYAKVLKDTLPETLLAENIEHNQKPENANSENLLIKGDNLEVLKHLKNAYKNVVKMIYIDPPYNTGSDGFVYQDDRQFTPQQLAELGGMDLDEAKRVLEFTAKKSNSHSAWLTFMYPRLYIARELLRDDGVIFISIDDNEQAQLKILCDEVFGEENFINIISTKTKNIAGASGGGEDKRLKKNLEFIIFYSKDTDKFQSLNNVYEFIPISQLLQEYHDNDISWKYTSVLTNTGEKVYITSTLDGDGNEIKIYKRLNYEIKSINQIIKEENISVTEAYNKYGNFIFEAKDAQSSIRTRVQDVRNKLGITDEVVSIEYIPRSGKNKGKLYEQFYKGDKCRLFAWLRDVSDYIGGELCKKDIQGTFWDLTKNMNNLNKEGGVPFPNGKKPIQMVLQMLKMISEDNSIILDFFAGSGTTAHAVMQLNAEDNGNRRFICVQLPENTDEKSEAHKAGYPTIFDITKARIEKAAAKIQTENPDYSGDLGFKIFQTEPNFQAGLDVDFDPTQAEIPDSKNAMLSDEQLHTLLTTWRVYDGSRLTEKVQAVDLAGYTAYYCREHLYLLANGFSSECVKALIEKLDNDKDFIPERIVLFSQNMESAMQKELAQAVKTYANKKGLNNLSVLARV